MQFRGLTSVGTNPSYKAINTLIEVERASRVNGGELIRINSAFENDLFD